MSGEGYYNVPRNVVVDDGKTYKVIYEDGKMLTTTCGEKTYWLRQELLTLVSLFSIFCSISIFRRFSTYFHFSTIFKPFIFQADPESTLLTARYQQNEAVKLMVLCAKKHNCMEMTVVARDNILSSGPARFQLLSAFHPTITARSVENFSRKLSTSFPRPLFEVMVKLEVVIAHLNNFAHADPLVKVTTDKIQRFCKSLANIYQVIFIFDFSTTRVLTCS